MHDVIKRPAAENFGPNFGNYIRLVADGDIRVILQSQLAAMLSLLRHVSEPESLVRHAPYSWSLREVVGHITDAERIFAYRALRMARADQTPLASFDENAYARVARFDQWPWAELLEEFDLVRRGNLEMVRHFEAAAWERGGVVSGMPMTVAGMVYVMAGHCQHHLDIMRKRLAKT